MKWLWHPGTPRAKGRPRLGKVGRDGIVTIFTPGSTHDEEALIGWEWTSKYRGDLPLACPVAVRIVAVGGGADADNVAKLVLDALNGIAYTDDRLVKHLSVKRLEASKDVPSGTYIEVRPMTGAWRPPLARWITKRLTAPQTIHPSGDGATV